MASQSIDRLLTRDEAAEHLGITVDELDQLRKTGTGPEWGQWLHTIRYDVYELDAWLKGHGSGKSSTVSAGPQTTG